MRGSSQELVQLLCESRVRELSHQLHVPTPQVGELPADWSGSCDSVPRQRRATAKMSSRRAPSVGTAFSSRGSTSSRAATWRPMRRAGPGRSQPKGVSVARAVAERVPSAVGELRAWQEPGVAPVPCSLRRLWTGERLPTRLSERVGIDLTVDELDADLWLVLPELPGALFEYIINLLQTRSARPEVQGAVVLGRGWPAGLDPRDLPLRERTRNCLGRAGLLRNTRRLSVVTYGELFVIKGMGATSVLDFACTADAALDAALGDVHDDTVVLERADQLALSIGDLSTAPTQGQLALSLTPDDEERLLRAVDAPWAEEIHERDPRFSDCFQATATKKGETVHDAPGRTVADLVEHALAPEVHIDVARDLASLLEEIEARVDVIASRGLDESLRDLIEAAGFSGTQSALLLARLGWGGTAPMTLEDAGRVGGVTRERARQIERKLIGRLPPRLYLPQLTRALRLLERSCPIDLKAAAERLVDERISSTALHPAGLIKAAERFGHPTALRIARQTGEDVLLTEESSAVALAVAAAVKQVMTPFRIFPVARVADAAREGNPDLAEEAIRSILPTVGARSLKDDWWVLEAEGRADALLGNLVKSIVAVSGEIGIAELREGVARRARQRHWNYPPRAVLLEFCRGRDDLIVVDERVRLAEQADWRPLLGDTDRCLVEVLLSAPGHVLDREAFQRRCVDRGVNPNTFSVYTTYSPYVERVGGGLWAVRGVHPDPVEAAELRERLTRRPRERRVLDHGWTSDGRLRLVVRLKDPGATVIGIPAAVVDYVRDRSFAIRLDGREIGAVVVDERGTSWGYGPFLSRKGAEPGDVLVVDFDLVGGYALLELSGEDTLDEEDED